MLDSNATQQETIAIFGATGNTGREVLAAALDQGYLVRVMVRSPSKVTVEHPNLTILQGDLTALDTIKETVQGADYVISVVGGPMGKPKNFPVGTFVQFTKDLVGILKQTPSTKVFVHQSGAYVANPDGTHPLSMKIMNKVVGWLAGIGPNLKENLNIEKYMDSIKEDVKFKMICTKPGGLRAGPGGKKFGATKKPSMGMSDLKDVGKFTITALKDESLYGKHTYVGYL